AGRPRGLVVRRRRPQVGGPRSDQLRRPYVCHLMMALDGGGKRRAGCPRNESCSVWAPESIGLFDWPSPTALNGLSGSAMNEAAASSGVKPTNHADRVLPVVPLLPATGRPA